MCVWVGGMAVDLPAVRPPEGVESSTDSGRSVSAHAALLVASLGALLAFLDATIVNVAFPDIRLSFPGSSLGTLSWVLNSYNIVFAAFLVPAGRLADLLGRRRVFTLGILVFTIASGLCAAAPSVGWLIAARGVQAAGAALLVPASLALVVATFPAERRSHAVGIWGAMAAAAAGLGPPLGGALVALDGWRLAFLINVPLGLAAIVAGRKVLVESRAPGRRTLPDLAGAGLLAVALALVTLAVVQGDEWGWTSVGVVAPLAVALGTSALFVRRSRRHPVPVLDPKLVRIRSFAVANAVSLAAGMGFYAYLLTNILWLHYVWGWSLLVAGLGVAPAALVAAAAAGVLGRLADVHGHRWIAVPGALVWAGAYVWYARQVGPDPAFLTEWLPGQVLSGIGVGATLPILGSAALAAVPGGRFATASSLVTSARQLGGVVGVSVLVVIVGTPAAATIAGRLQNGWLFSAGCFVVVAAGSLLLRREVADVAEHDGAELTPLVEVAPRLDARASRPASGAASLFVALPEEGRARLLGSATAVDLTAGDWLFHAGDASDSAYVVRAGRLEVIADGEVIRELGPDDVVGELGLLAGTPRSAAVRARRDSRLLRVSAAQFDAALAGSAESRRVLTATLAAQLQASRGLGDVAAAAPRVISVVGASPGAQVEEVARALVAALAEHVRVAALHQVDVDGLDRAERENDRVVLVAAGGDEDWRSFCLRQADRLVVVADGDAQPRFLPRDRPTYLVLAGDRPERARLLEWHDAVEPRRSYVYASPDDLTEAAAELAARLTGRSIGVALAGGGARALAGIGVLAELEAAGLRVDRLSGCSIGSVVAALYATGRDAAAVDAVCYDELVRRSPFGDLTVPRIALLRGRRAEAALRRRLDDVHFEELPRELALVSTDILSRSTAVHRRGLVREAVRASLSLPALLPPARVGETLHIDGGILENLPVSPLDPDEGPSVAVNIAAAGSSPKDGRPLRLPTLPETLLRSILMGSAAAVAVAKERATVTVTPDTRGIGLFEFHQIDRAVEAGRAAGVAAVEALRNGRD
jgi:NTE family protein